MEGVNLSQVFRFVNKVKGKRETLRQPLPIVSSSRLILDIDIVTEDINEMVVPPVLHNLRDIFQAIDLENNNVIVFVWY